MSNRDSSTISGSLGEEIKKKQEEEERYKYAEDDDDMGDDYDTEENETEGEVMSEKTSNKNQSGQFLRAGSLEKFMTHQNSSFHSSQQLTEIPYEKEYQHSSQSLDERRSGKPSYQSNEFPPSAQLEILSKRLTSLGDENPIKNFSNQLKHVNKIIEGLLDELGKNDGPNKKMKKKKKHQHGNLDKVNKGRKICCIMLKNKNLHSMENCIVCHLISLQERIDTLIDKLSTRDDNEDVKELKKEQTKLKRQLENLIEKFDSEAEESDVEDNKKKSQKKKESQGKAQGKKSNAAGDTGKERADKDKRKAEETSMPPEGLLSYCMYDLAELIKSLNCLAYPGTFWQKPATKQTSPQKPRRRASGKCCNRDYRHIHGELNGVRVVVKLHPSKKKMKKEKSELQEEPVQQEYGQEEQEQQDEGEEEEDDEMEIPRESYEPPEPAPTESTGSQQNTTIPYYLRSFSSADRIRLQEEDDEENDDEDDEEEEEEEDKERGSSDYAIEDLQPRNPEPDSSSQKSHESQQKQSSQNSVTDKESSELKPLQESFQSQASKSSKSTKGDKKSIGSESLNRKPKKENIIDSDEEFDDDNAIEQPTKKKKSRLREHKIKRPREVTTLTLTLDEQFCTPFSLTNKSAKYEDNCENDISESYESCMEEFNLPMNFNKKMKMITQRTIQKTNEKFSVERDLKNKMKKIISTKNYYRNNFTVSDEINKKTSKDDKKIIIEGLTPSEIFDTYYKNNKNLLFEIKPCNYNNNTKENTPTSKSKSYTIINLRKSESKNSINDSLDNKTVNSSLTETKFESVNDTKVKSDSSSKSDSCLNDKYSFDTLLNSVLTSSEYSNINKINNVENDFVLNNKQTNFNEGNKYNVNKYKTKKKFYKEETSSSMSSCSIKFKMVKNRSKIEIGMKTSRNIISKEINKKTNKKNFRREKFSNAKNQSKKQDNFLIDNSNNEDKKITSKNNINSKDNYNQNNDNKIEKNKFETKKIDKEKVMPLKCKVSKPDIRKLEVFLNILNETKQILNFSPECDNMNFKNDSCFKNFSDKNDKNLINDNILSDASDESSSYDTCDDTCSADFMDALSVGSTEKPRNQTEITIINKKNSQISLKKLLKKETKKFNRHLKLSNKNKKYSLFNTKDVNYLDNDYIITIIPEDNDSEKCKELFKKISINNCSEKSIGVKFCSNDEAVINDLVSRQNHFNQYNDTTYFHPKLTPKHEQDIVCANLRILKTDLQKQENKLCMVNNSHETKKSVLQKISNQLKRKPLIRLPKYNLMTNSKLKNRQTKLEKEQLTLTPYYRTSQVNENKTTTNLTCKDLKAEIVDKNSDITSSDKKPIINSIDKAKYQNTINTSTTDYRMKTDDNTINGRENVDEVDEKRHNKLVKECNDKTTTKLEKFGTSNNTKKSFINNINKKKYQPIYRQSKTLYPAQSSDSFSAITDDSVSIKSSVCLITSQSNDYRSMANNRRKNIFYSSKYPKKNMKKTTSTENTSQSDTSSPRGILKRTKYGIIDSVSENEVLLMKPEKTMPEMRYSDDQYDSDNTIFNKKKLRKKSVSFTIPNESEQKISSSLSQSELNKTIIGNASYGLSENNNHHDNKEEEEIKTESKQIILNPKHRVKIYLYPNKIQYSKWLMTQNIIEIKFTKPLHQQHTKQILKNKFQTFRCEEYMEIPITYTLKLYHHLMPIASNYISTIKKLNKFTIPSQYIEKRGYVQKLETFNTSHYLNPLCMNLKNSKRNITFKNNNFNKNKMPYERSKTLPINKKSILNKPRMNYTSLNNIKNKNDNARKKTLKNVIGDSQKPLEPSVEVGKNQNNNQFFNYLEEVKELVSHGDCTNTNEELIDVDEHSKFLFNISTKPDAILNITAKNEPAEDQNEEHYTPINNITKTQEIKCKRPSTAGSKVMRKCSNKNFDSSINDINKLGVSKKYSNDDLIIQNRKLNKDSELSSINIKIGGVFKNKSFDNKKKINLVGRIIEPKTENEYTSSCSSLSTDEDVISLSNTTRMIPKLKTGLPESDLKKIGCDKFIKSLQPKNSLEVNIKNNNSHERKKLLLTKSNYTKPQPFNFNHNKQSILKNIKKSYSKHQCILELDKIKKEFSRPRSCCEPMRKINKIQIEKNIHTKEHRLKKLKKHSKSLNLINLEQKDENNKEILIGVVLSDDERNSRKDYFTETTNRNWERNQYNREQEVNDFNQILTFDRKEEIQNSKTSVASQTSLVMLNKNKSQTMTIKSVISSTTQTDVIKSPSFRRNTSSDSSNRYSSSDEEIKKINIKNRYVDLKYNTNVISSTKEYETDDCISEKSYCTTLRLKKELEYIKDLKSKINTTFPEESQVRKNLMEKVCFLHSNQKVKPFFPENDGDKFDCFGAPLKDDLGRPYYNDYGKPIVNIHGCKIYDNNGIPKRGAYGKPIHGALRSKLNIALQHMKIVNKIPERNKNFEEDLLKVLNFYTGLKTDLYGRIYDAYGRPLFDCYGYLQYDQNGNPTTDAFNRPLHDKNGKPLITQTICNSTNFKSVPPVAQTYQKKKICTQESYSFKLNQENRNYEKYSSTTGTNIQKEKAHGDFMDNGDTKKDFFHNKSNSHYNLEETLDEQITST